jgi:hypothetical protein
MGTIEPIKVLKPNVDFVPLAKTDIDSMKEDIVLHGNYLLLLLLHGGDNYTWSKEEISNVLPGSIQQSLSEDIPVLLSKGILIMMSDGHFCLNLEYPIFRYLLVHEDTIERPKINLASRGTIGGSNSNYNEGGAGGSKQDHSGAKERLLKLVNQLRKDKFDARPQRMGVIISAVLEDTISKHGEKACTTVAESYFEWEGLRSKFATIQSTFSNFDKKMQIALSKNSDIASVIKDLPPTKDNSPMWMLYDHIAKNFDKIQKNEKQVVLVGELKDRQIASLAYRLFLKKLCGRKPVEWDDPQGMWNSCVKQATSMGGILVTADDDININGKNLTAEKTNVMVS